MVWKSNKLLKYATAKILCYAALLCFTVFSANASQANNEAKNAADKKTLYLHVGTHKTGTSTIQEECTKNRSKLKELGILYPEPIKKTTFLVNHHSIAHLIDKRAVKELNDYILDIKDQARNYDSVFLSSEVFAHIALKPEFSSFLKSLRDHFTVKIIYCDRDFIDRVSSLATYLAVVGTPFPEGIKTIDDYIRSEKDKEEKVKKFFANEGAQFLSYEDLKKDNKLVENFLYTVFGVKAGIPNSFYNTMAQLKGPELSAKKLVALEAFYGTNKGVLIRAWGAGKDENRLEFAALITKIAKDRAKVLYGKEKAPVSDAK